MTWKTALDAGKGILSGAGVIGGIAAVAKSADFGEVLAGYLKSGGSQYMGLQSREAQAVSDLLSANLAFYDHVRFLLLFGGIAMICFFGLVLADALKQIPVDVLVDSQGVDSLRRRVARAAAHLARRLDPEAEDKAEPAPEPTEPAPAAMDFTASAQPVPEELVAQQHRS